MKKIVLFLLAGLLALGTSCSKHEDTGKLAELASLTAKAMLLSQSDYTAASWAPFATALDEAKRVLGSASPPTAVIETAITNLNNAMRALADKNAIRADLGTAITVSEQWPNSGYTAASWNTFQEALTAAKTVYADPNATVETISQALVRLMVAFQSLSKA